MAGLKNEQNSFSTSTPLKKIHKLNAEIVVHQPKLNVGIRWRGRRKMSEIKRAITFVVPRPASSMFRFLSVLSPSGVSTFPRQPDIKSNVFIHHISQTDSGVFPVKKNIIMLK